MYRDTNLSSPEERLMLLSARPSWTEAERAIAISIAPDVKQWKMLIEIVQRKMAIQLVYANLATLPEALLPDEVGAQLRAASTAETLQSLRRQAAFDWLHSNCVETSGVRYAYFKGPALAARFYPDPAIRMFRDIDILVAQKERYAVVRCMLEQGCRAFEGSGSSVRYHDLSYNQIHDFVSVVRVPNLITPHGLVIEVHSEVDPALSLFPTDILLSETHNLKLRQYHLNVLSDLDHVLFALYHHTRHMWSHLHWLADLNACLTSPLIDTTALLARAERIGLKTTISAVMEFHDLVSQARHPLEFTSPTPGVDLLNACHKTVAAGSEVETELRKQQRAGVFSYDWQDTPISFSHKTKRALRMLAPSYQGYSKLRWAGRVAYPLAIVSRIAHGLRRKLKGQDFE